MIVQTRSRTLRLIRQHDHALASGRLAHDWVGFGPESAPLSHEAILGIALHDVGWTTADESPRWDPETRGVHGFETYPKEERTDLYSRGLDLAERVHPYAGLLGNLHYSRFAMPESWLASERNRGARLREQLGLDEAAAVQLRRDLDCLVLLDDLSLFVCCCHPDAVTPPDWLAAARIGRRKDGSRFELTWRDGATLTMDPFPLRQAVELRIPCRDLPRERFSDPESLQRAWDAADRGTQAVRVVPTAG